MGKTPSGSPRKAGIISLGCPKNLVDTEFLMGCLGREGWSFVADPRRADVIIVNTCAFIEEAVRESEETIREVLEARRPGAAVAVTGCLVSLRGRSLRKDFPGVDLFVMPGGLGAAAPRLGSPGTLRGGFVGGSRGFLPAPGAARSLTTGAWAYLKISDGCDNRCAYCLIPRLRGRHRPRPLGSILGEASALVAAGAREINLVAQDTTRWKGAGGTGLAGLVSALAALPGEFRLRLLYLHPARIDEALLEVMASEPKVFPYADLPMQHASGRVLEAMNRPYDRRRLSRLYGSIRRRLPWAALRTTVMVGYPGEGRREFRSLEEFLADHPFENLGAFVFSPQEGTPAASLGPRVPAEVAEERYHRIMSAQAARSARLWSARVGRTVEALIEGADGTSGTWVGRAAWQAPEVDGKLRIRAPGPPGILARVRITGAAGYDLEGEVE